MNTNINRFLIASLIFDLGANKFANNSPVVSIYYLLTGKSAGTVELVISHRGKQYSKVMHLDVFLHPFSQSVDYHNTLVQLCSRVVGSTIKSYSGDLHTDIDNEVHVSKRGREMMQDSADLFLVRDLIEQEFNNKN
jgi:hypothetical protein